MKSVLTTILFFISVQCVFSQIPFAPVGAKYYMNAEYPPDYSYNFSWQVVSTDTVLLGKYCTQLKDEGRFFTCGFEDTFIHSDSQRVYVYDETNQEFSLVYDFSKNEGESYRIKVCPDYLGTDSVTINILSIDSISYNSTPAVRQRLEVVSDSGGWYNSIEYDIYEGIGGRVGNILLFYPTIGTTAHAFFETACYYSEYTGAVGIAWGSGPCIPVSTDEDFQNNYFSIFPNPSSGSTQLNYDLPPNFKNTKISIHNSTGQLLQSFPLKNQRGENEINNLPTGIYFITMLSDGQPVASEKLIVL